METKHTYIPQGTCSRLIEFTLDGTVVRGKGTSCPDQFARALREAMTQRTAAE